MVFTAVDLPVESAEQSVGEPGIDTGGDPSLADRFDYVSRGRRIDVNGGVRTADLDRVVRVGAAGHRKIALVGESRCPFTGTRVFAVDLDRVVGSLDFPDGTTTIGMSDDRRTTPIVGDFDDVFGFERFRDRLFRRIRSDDEHVSPGTRNLDAGDQCYREVAPVERPVVIVVRRRKGVEAARVGSATGSTR